jgi:hypothetical protein
LKIAFQDDVQFAAVDHDAIFLLVLHLLQRVRVGNHVAGKLVATFRVVRTDMYAKCSAAHVLYLGLEVDDALEIAEHTET